MLQHTGSGDNKPIVKNKPIACCVQYCIMWYLFLCTVTYFFSLLKYWVFLLLNVIE